MTPNHKLTPAQVVAMPLKEFERRFGWKPRDPLEKHYFAGCGERITPMVYEAIQAGVLGPVDLSHVVMED